MENDFELLIDDDYKAPFTEEEARQFKPILIDFISDYDKNRDKPVSEWLVAKMQSMLPEKNKAEIQQYVDDIEKSVKINEEKHKSLREALSNGKSRDSWFAGEIMQATSQMSAQQSMEYMKSLDNALADANAKMYQTLLTKEGLVSQNPNLDGYIAEQHHAQTFNLNAAAKGSKYRARVVEPDGTYNKNGVDIVIEDTTTGKVVSRYQSKYCKDSAATESAFESGDYRGQQKLTPSDQTIGKKSTDVLKAPDGTTSNPLSKADAQKLRDEAQSGKWNDLNWNEYKAKDLAIGIGKQAGKAGLIGAAVGAGAEIANKLLSGEEIDGKEVAKAAIKGGADAGLKSVVAGALKVGIEKGVIKAIPKGTPVGVLATIASIGIENVKVIGEVVSGKLSPAEGVGKIADVTVSGITGAVAAAGGSMLGTMAAVKIGALVGTAVGPVGTAIGGFIGGTIGFVAGSAVGKAVVSGAKKVAKAAVGITKGLVNAGKKAFSAVKNFLFG